MEANHKLTNNDYISKNNNVFLLINNQQVLIFLRIKHHPTINEKYYTQPQAICHTYALYHKPTLKLGE